MLIPVKRKRRSETANEENTGSIVEMLTPPKPKRGSENVVNKDRLSDLPDCLLLHIMSFMKAKCAVQTCVLSTRWKDLWKCVPSITLLSPDFVRLKSFTDFMNKLLDLRDRSAALHSFDFERRGSMEFRYHKRVVSYVLSHKVQQLRFAVVYNLSQILRIFSCQSLTSLELLVHTGRSNPSGNLFPVSSCLNLPALTSLHLGCFTFSGGINRRAEPFSAFKKLHSLIIDNCSIKDAQTFCISSTTLVDVTIIHTLYGDFKEVELSAPSLHRLDFTGSTPRQRLCGSSLSSVKELSIDVDMRAYAPEPPLILLSWLEELTNIKSLTVSTSTLQVLFLIPNLVKRKLAFLCHLKSLKVKVERFTSLLRTAMIDVKIQKAATVSQREAARLHKEADIIEKTKSEHAPIPAGILNFLLQNSPSAEVKTKSCYRRIYGML
ncbi:F-box protein At4g22280-like [Lotus japonicus]|uniref:F-box protein At4g22280-like n=1 Tax=Lotus japonicus TaxID=34305 RepID=UPI00258893F2|nr:F-box protein At4g22280-like [Lotus japonicus]